MVWYSHLFQNFPQFVVRLNKSNLNMALQFCNSLYSSVCQKIIFTLSGSASFLCKNKRLIGTCVPTCVEVVSLRLGKRQEHNKMSDHLDTVTKETSAVRYLVLWAPCSPPHPGPQSGLREEPGALPNWIVKVYLHKHRFIFSLCFFVAVHICLFSMCLKIESEGIQSQGCRIVLCIQAALSPVFAL